MQTDRIVPEYQTFALNLMAWNRFGLFWMEHTLYLTILTLFEKKYNIGKKKFKLRKVYKTVTKAITIISYKEFIFLGKKLPALIACVPGHPVYEMLWSLLCSLTPCCNQSMSPLLYHAHPSSHSTVQVCKQFTFLLCHFDYTCLILMQYCTYFICNTVLLSHPILYLFHMQYLFHIQYYTYFSWIQILVSFVQIQAC